MVQIKNKWGWVVTVCTFIVIIPLTGIPSSFGVIFVKLQEEYEITDLETGWIGSVAFGMFFFASPISTGLFKRYGHRKVAIGGVILCSIGMLASSFVPNPSLLFLTYSAIYGVGSNFIDNTSLNLIGEYFPRKNSARATCFATLGWSVGSLVFNPLIEVLCARVGWRYTFRILCGVVAVVGIPCVLTYSPAPIERPWKKLESAEGQKKSLMENSPEEQEKPTFREYIKTFLEALQAPGMWLWIFGNILANLSLIFPFVNMIKFMTTIGIPEFQGALTLTAMGVTDLLGRTISSLIGDRIPFHVVYLYPLSSLVMALGIFSLLMISSFPGMVIFASGFGFFIGVFNSMLFKACMDLFGSEILAEAWTLTYVASGIGIMVGPSIAGATYDHTQSFTIAFYIGGGLCILGALVFIAIPLVQKRKDWNPKKALSTPTDSTEFSTLTEDSTEEFLEARITTI
ncbi:monocarboxylate transporter 10-like isoform X2 [Ptychodera flava]|uniref:monocarboxylate transporter 10-like isoform X2 n=1 Tax=Ptychodera flava TaxID=63121 RepID=UPI003969CA7E